MSSDNIPGSLNLNAPLLSTRRPLSLFRSTSSPPASASAPLPPERIPFSWERAPGLPKSLDVACSQGHKDHSVGGDFTPRPRPPPSHYYSPSNFTFQHHLRQSSLCVSDPRKVDYKDEDDDEGYYCCYDNPASGRDSLSTSNFNAEDVFSLSEAIDVLEKSEGPGALESDSNLKALKRMAESAEDTSPSFMINRFLPDANALAESSALRWYSGNWNDKTRGHRRYSSYSLGNTGGKAEAEEERRSSGRSDRKGCGMERVFQWRMKPRFCGESRPSPVLGNPSLLGNRRNPS